MFGKINKRRIFKNSLIISLIIMLILAPSIPFIGFDRALPGDQFEDQQNAGEAEALGLTTGIVIGVVGAGAGAAAYSEFIEDGNSVTKNQVNESDLQEVNNASLRQATHTSAIISSGNSEAFFSNVDNNLNTIEGSLEQRLNQMFIREGDNITTETQAVAKGENRASKYLKTIQDNLIEFNNFATLSLKQYNEQLIQAGAEQDIFTRGKWYEVNNNFGNLIENQNVTKIRVNDSAQISDKNRNITGDKIIDLNGNDLTILENIKVDDNTTIEFRNGTISQANALTNVFSQMSDLNLNFKNVTPQSVNFDASNDVDVYADEDSDISGLTVKDSKNLINNVSEPSFVRGGADITFDLQEIADANDNIADPSDVPTTEVSDDNGTVQLPAKQFNLDSGYYGSDNTVNVAVPYIKSTGEPIENYQSVYVETTTSGTSDVVQPINYSRALSLIQDRDNVAGSAFDFVESYSRGVWTDTISKVAFDSNKSITDLPNISSELGNLQYGDVDLSDPLSVLTQYVGVYESTTDPVNDRATVTHDGETYKGAIFSTDIKKVANQHVQRDEINVGDTFDGSGLLTDIERTFIVDQNTAEVTELDGPFTVDNIEGGGPLNLRTYETESTDLSERAREIADARDSIEIVLPEDGAGGGGSGGFGIGSGGLSTVLLLVAGGGLLVILLNRRREQ